MATRKHEDFAFGGVDARSNPANYPSDRALRCLNWTPMQRGSLQLRFGYTVPTTDGGDTTSIHSMVYYEQYAAAYLGPQFVLFGKGTNIKQYALSGGAVTTPGSFTTSNPWGHFRSGNRVFLADGVTAQNWDGVTMRTTGIPGIANVLIGPTSNYASSATTFGAAIGPAWSSITNAIGPPDGSYATVSMGTTDLVTRAFALETYGFAVPAGYQILGMKVEAIAHYTGTGTAPTLNVNPVWLGTGHAALGQIGIAIIHQTTDTTLVLGGATNVFGSGVTAPAANDVTFGVAIYAAQQKNGNFSGTVFVDSAKITLYFVSLNGIIVSVTTSTLGSIAPTQLTGYQLYLALYNPTTQHMGNRGPIGGLNTVGATLSAFLISGIPTLSSFDPEWVYAVGMTNDGGQLPYWFVDAQGDNIVIGNSATMGTVYLGNVNAQQELPVRNDIPPPLDKFARVGTRIFGHLSGNQFLNYSNDVADVSNADYVGKPEESWPADQTEPLPTGKQPTSIHSYRLEGWFFDKDYLSIWSLFLKQQDANPWRGPWAGGCCGQRAFVETPYGPYWVSPQKQLCTFMSDGVVSVSDEYEASLLHQLADATMGSVEIAYEKDPENLIDKIFIRGLDGDGNTVVVVHDFLLRDERGPHGQGYQFAYTGATINTFAGAGFTPRQNVYDVNGKMRLWAGTAEGFFSQLEDGTSDNSATYSGDYLALVSLGPDRPTLAELEIQGDQNLEVAYTTDYDNGDLTAFTPAVAEQIPGESTRYGYMMTGEGRWAYFRLQLTSHPADGNFDITDPPFIPIPSYSVVNMSVLKLGLARPQGR